MHQNDKQPGIILLSSFFFLKLQKNRRNIKKNVSCKYLVFCLKILFYFIFHIKTKSSFADFFYINTFIYEDFSIHQNLICSFSHKRTDSVFCWVILKFVLKDGEVHRDTKKSVEFLICFHSLKNVLFLLCWQFYCSFFI